MIQTTRFCDLFDGRLKDGNPTLTVFGIVRGELDRGRGGGRRVLGDDLKAKVALVLTVLKGLDNDVTQIDHPQRA